VAKVVRSTEVRTAAQYTKRLKEASCDTARQG
jgi:hypothetical protein